MAGTALRDPGERNISTGFRVLLVVARGALDCGVFGVIEAGAGLPIVAGADGHNLPGRVDMVGFHDVMAQSAVECLARRLV